MFKWRSDRQCTSPRFRSSLQFQPLVRVSTPKTQQLDHAAQFWATAILQLCCISEDLLLDKQFYLLLLAHQLVKGDEIVLEDVEEQILLFEDFNPDGLFIVAVTLAELVDEVLGFLVDGRGTGLGLVVLGGDEEELLDLGERLYDSFDVLLSDGVVAEVEEDCDGGIGILDIFHVYEREQFLAVSHLVVRIEILELLEQHVFGIIRHEVPACFHYLQHCSVYFKVSARLGLEGLEIIGVVLSQLFTQTLHPC